jgi:hypothetical protein
LHNLPLQCGSLNVVHETLVISWYEVKNNGLLHHSYIEYSPVFEERLHILSRHATFTSYSTEI